MGVSVKLTVRRKKKGINRGVETGEEAKAGAVGVGPPSAQVFGQKKDLGSSVFVFLRFSSV